MNTATLTVVLHVHDHDEDKGAEVEKRKIVPTEILIGDGNAQTWREFSMTIKGGDYNALAMSITAGVKITCNQDDESITKALNSCHQLAKGAIKEYMPTLQAMLDELVEARAK